MATRKIVKKKTVKSAKTAKKVAVKAKKVPALQCGICGYRVVVDQACGCVEEHVLLCCNQPMTKV
jgi:uncharacterized ferredoxin-like protein